MENGTHEVHTFAPIFAWNWGRLDSLEQNPWQQNGLKLHSLSALALSIKFLSGQLSFFLAMAGERCL